MTLQRLHKHKCFICCEEYDCANITQLVSEIIPDDPNDTVNYEGKFVPCEEEYEYAHSGCAIAAWLCGELD